MKTIRSEKENVVPYLQDKYGEAFTLASYVMRSIDIPYDEAVCINAQGQKVKVYIAYEEDCVEMTDDYYGTMKIHQYREDFREILKQFNMEGKLLTRFAANYFDNAYNRETPLSQAMAENKEQFYTRTFLFIPESTQIEEDTVTMLREILLQKNMTMYLAVYPVAQDVYAAIDETEKAGDYIVQYNLKPLYEETIK